MSILIEGVQNPKVKLATSLKQKKYRDSSGLFITEGLRLCEEAVKSDYHLEYCLCCDDIREMDKVRYVSLKEHLSARKCPIYYVTRQLYNKISDTQEPQGILLVVHQRDYTLPDLLGSNDNPLIVALDGIQDPGNLGTIVRTADAAGCSGVVLLKNTVDLFSPKTIRATMGSVFHLPVMQSVDAKDFLEFLVKKNSALFVTQLDKAAKPYFEANFTLPTTIVFGNESNGVSEAMKLADGESIFIPMPGQAESLNVSTAASIMIYEALRQRMAL